MEHIVKNSAYPEDLGTILPQGEKLAMSQEEYIRTLEVWNQLLQREIENLRHQPRPPVASLQSDTDTESLEHTARLIQSYSSAEQVIATLQEYTSRRFPVIDGSIFMVDTSTNKLQPSLDGSDETFLYTIKVNLEEEGIIDWVIRRKKTVVIPNFHTNLAEQRTSYIIVPLFLRGAAVGVFIARTPASSSDFKREDIAALTILAESAAIALDNIRSASEISQMNRRLNSLNKQMVQSAKLASIGELAGSVAHEINNPLQILLGHIQLLESGVGDAPRRLNIIREQVYRISEITRRLLDFARTTPGDMTPEPVNLLTLAEEVLLFVGSQLRRDGIEVEKISDSPPPLAYGNRSQIEQVLLNLIINARDAMPEGGKLVIAVFSDNDRRACVSVADTGVGIEPNDLDHIFEPFFSTKPRGKGTGLGLSIAREIIRQHNGALDVASEPGKGTTFKISLPAASAEREIRMIG